MDKLTPQFLENCRSNKGMTLRGENMTRIETFVDAAFAFAFTMLVISIDQIPQSPQELLELSKDIPAFVFSALVLGSIWLSHSNWSRIFGLQDPITIILSLLLVILVLVFVYPIKLMMQTTVLYFSLAWFELDFMNTGLFDGPGWDEPEVVGQLFIYVAVGLISLSAILISFYQNTLRYREELVLNENEIRYCIENSLVWGVVAVTALFSALLALLTSDNNVSLSGFIYASLGVTINFALRIYYKYHPQLKED